MFEDTQRKESSLKKMGKWLTVALFVGAASYTIYNQEGQVMAPLPEEIATSVDPVVANADELVELAGEDVEDALINDVSVGCGVNIDRLMDQKKATADWNANINSRSKYEDSTFPARKDYALYWADYLDQNALQTVNAQGSMKGYNSVTVWQRPDEFDTSRAPSLFGDKGLEPHGIKQGGIGDCYFLAAAAAMAERPERVAKVFENTSYSPSGIFMLNMFVRGEPVRVVVDDRFPVKPNPTGRYVPQMFNAKKSPHDAWWGPILEKAYCKMNIACTYINSGSSLESFRDLTGMPTEQFRIREQTNAAFFKVVKEAIADQWMIVAGTAVAQNGLQSGHAYSIQDTATINGEDLVKLRNPWGTAHYSGPWATDDKTRWTAAMKAKLGWKAKNDGLFWIPVNDFRQSFNEYIVCLYQDWKVDRLRLKPANFQSMKVNVQSPVDQKAILTLDYENSRKTPPGCAGRVKSTNHNMFIRVGRKKIAQKAVFRNIGYGYFRWPEGLKAGTNYEIEVYDFAGASLQDFSLTLYSETQTVEIANPRKS